MTKSSIEIIEKDNIININVINLGIATKKSGSSWTVFAPNLKVLGYSNKSQKAALADFEKNLKLFFGVHLKHKTLDRALVSFKWKERSLSRPEFALGNAPALNLKDFNLSIAA
jgi:hypothetical protein